MKDCVIISLQKYAYRPILIFNRQPMIADPLNVFKGMNFNVVPCKNNVFICYLFDNVHCGQFSQFMGHICGKGPILPHQSLFVITGPFHVASQTNFLDTLKNSIS